MKKKRDSAEIFQNKLITLFMSMEREMKFYALVNH